MNEEQISFQINERKFTIKLVPDIKPKNKVHCYIMSKSEDIIDLTITEDDITEVLEDDESHPIMIESEERNTSSDNEMEVISRNLKGKFLDEAITSYKVKCHQYIEQRKAE